jgi:long-chain acyl-CoA synthetase
MGNMVELIHETVVRHRERNALGWKQDGAYQHMTYGEFWDQVQSIAHALQELGIGLDGKVGLLSDNRPAWTISDVGILACGAVCVPIYPTLTSAQIGFILGNADVEAIIVENAELADKVLAVATETLHTIILIEPDARIQNQPGVRLFSDMVARGRSLLAEKGPITTWKALPDTTLATIVHTSGTTGNPKGVMLTHGNLVSNATAMLEYVPVQPTDCSLSYLPLSHIFERTVGQFALLISGATINYAESLAKIQQNLVEVRPTMLTSVPRLFEKIYDGVYKNVRESSRLKQQIFQWAVANGTKNRHQPTWRTRMLAPLFDRLVFAQIREKMGGNIRLLVSGGGALSPVIGEFLSIAGLNVCEGYGMTETSPVVSNSPITDLRIGTVGKPLVNLQVKIAEDGELLVKGPSVMVGYYKAPEATAEAFDEEGYLKTGDIAELVDGYLRIVERKKNILVLATGKNVAPFPIESALSRSPYLSQAVLFGDKRKYVTAILVPDFEVLNQWAQEQGLDLPIPQLIEHPRVRELIDGEVQNALTDFAGFEKPKKFLLLDHEFTLESGEMTATLKVRTHVLFQKYREQIEAMYEQEGVGQGIA